MTFLDLWRGIALILMLIYHYLYTEASFGFFSWESFYSPVLNLLQLFICSSFIVVSGASCRLSRSNIRRGLIVAACAVAVTIASYFAGLPILFGILHFLGASLLLYSFIGKFAEKLPTALAPVLYAVFFILSRYWIKNAAPVNSKLLWPFGFVYPGFYSADYFPLLPWFFMFLFGTWLGGALKQKASSDGWHWLYTPVPPVFTWPGRHSLIIYLLHQPAFYALMYLRSVITR